MKTFRSAFVSAVLASVALTGGVAHAATVQFNGSPSTSFADGTFTTGLSGDFPDGFYTESSTSAYNGYGQNNEAILFTSAVTLDSLTIAKCSFCDDTSPTEFYANYYQGATLIESLGVTPSYTPTTLSSPVAGVTELTFTFTGGNNAYGDGRIAAWYTVSDVTYTSGVPEPSTWAMMLIGFAGLGFAGYRQTKRKDGVAFSAA